MRAIDFHTHLPTADWLDGSMGPYVENAEAYFRRKVSRSSIEELAQMYQDLDAAGVVLAWDAESFTGRPPVPNETVAEIQRRFPGRFIGFASVDPHRPDAALRFEHAIVELGLRGGKFHPSLQNFDPSDQMHFPLWAKASELGVPLIFHTGTSGIGAGTPGGQGIRIDRSRPLLLDPVAAAFPDLTLVMAHFGWPWHLEAIAMALHKTNVLLDISGWAPRYIPAEVVAEMKGRLQEQVLWGSDYPFIDPARCLDEISRLGLGEAERSILYGNAARILHLS